jgi:hypothetical protein
MNALDLGEQPLRYSEDIDLVQTHPEAIGSTVDAVRDALSWLGKCSRSQAAHSMHLVSSVAAESGAEAKSKLKVEINTREHQSLFGIKKYPFEIDSGWYKSRTEVASYEAEELFGTKLRALLQRQKNRDLFDLNEGLNQLSLNKRPSKTRLAFAHPPSRAKTGTYSKSSRPMDRFSIKWARIRSSHPRCSSVNCRPCVICFIARSTRSGAVSNGCCSSAACLTIEIMSTSALW